MPAHSEKEHDCKEKSTILMDISHALLAGSLINGTGTNPRRDIFLAVKDGIIVAVGEARDLPTRAGVVVDDLRHCTLVPALVDCSVSLSRSAAMDPRLRDEPETAGAGQRAALLARHLRDCHDHGVLGVADGDDATGLVRRPVAEGREGGLVALRTSGRLCRSREDGASSGSDRDFLKIGFSADIDAAEALGPTRMSPEDLGVLLGIDRALKKVVVANGRQAVAEALAAGCDAIEQGYGMGGDNLRVMAERQVLWIPGVVRAKNGLDSAGGDGGVGCRFSLRFAPQGEQRPGVESFWKSMFADQMAQLRLARTLGVPVAIGTGAGRTGILHGESVVEEIKLFIKAGYTLAEALRCASEIGARFFAMEKLGTLTVGRPATFLVTRGTAHQLPRKLSYLEHIYINGQPSSGYRKNPVKVGTGG